MSNQAKRVLCAMSGGVDSSVTAKQLLDQGYEILGVTMLLLDTSTSGENIRYDAAGLFVEDAAGLSPEIDDAKAVAQRLGIEHKVVDYRKLFDERVVTPFCNAYRKGLTPNPCIECNKYLKFEALQALREHLGFDYVATGHYAQVCYNDAEERFELHRAKDPSKDQSYVLYHLSQDYLAHTLFPLGSLTKAEVRKLAEKACFTNAQKPESQDICFIPDGDYAHYIEQHQLYSPEPGPITDTQGKVLGEHSGLIHYTIGQRKGLGVAVGEPLFVLEKNTISNTLIVGRKEEAAITSLEAVDVVFPCGTSFESSLRVKAKVNYRAALRDVRAYTNPSGHLVVVFDEPIQSAAPGQAVVLYDDSYDDATVIAGGTISNIFRKLSK